MQAIDRINAKLEARYHDTMFWFNTTIQATVFDAIHICYRISQTWLTGNIPYPERFHQMIYIEQNAILQSPESVRTRYMLRQ